MSETRYNDAVANSLGEAIGFRACLSNLLIYGHGVFEVISLSWRDSVV